jgi:hypothetical protein
MGDFLAQQRPHAQQAGGENATPIQQLLTTFGNAGAATLHEQPCTNARCQ